MSIMDVKINKMSADVEHYGGATHQSLMRVTNRQTTDWAPTTDDMAVVIFLVLLVCVVMPSFIFILYVYPWTCKSAKRELTFPSDSELEKSRVRRVVMPYLTPQVAFAAIYLFSCSVWNSACQVMVDHWTFYQQLHAAEITSVVLPDIGFHLLPHLKTPNLADVYNAGMLATTVAIFQLFHPLRAKLLKRFCLLQGTLFMLRSITIVVTLLPNPYHSCVLHPARDESFIAEGLKVMGGSRTTCGDVMYSGHSVNMTLMNLFWQENYPSHWRTAAFVRSFWWLVNIVGLIVCVTTHFHYTVDVLIGPVLTCLFWALYHRTIKYPHILAAEGELLGSFLLWFESEWSPGRLSPCRKGKALNVDACIGTNTCEVPEVPNHLSQAHEEFRPS